MKIEIDNQTTTTIGAVIAILIIEYLMLVLKVNYIVDISIDIVLCILFNIYNYKRFRHFQTKKDLQLTNKRLALALLFMNLTFIISIISILIRLY